jgi:glyoxylase-like metal-dependent hydrolase (beta-lactamase superfamily II)
MRFKEWSRKNQVFLPFRYTMLHVKSFTFNPFEENTYVLFDENRNAAVVDPGCYTKNEKADLEGYITKENLNVRLIINTHCHIDHVLGNAWVKRAFGVPLAMHPIEEQVLRAVKVYAPNYGFTEYEEVLPDTFLNASEFVKVGSESLQVLFVPGHSPGHIALYDRTSRILIAGDVLFRNSIGRTDLPGGDYDTLISSIHEQLFPLPEDTVVYCGHGPSTTIGFEKKTNPFCALPA